MTEKEKIERLKKLAEEQNRLTPDVVMEYNDSMDFLSPGLMSAMCNVLEKVPYEVLEHVHENCDFIEVLEGGGKCIDAKLYENNIIVLASNIKEGDREDIIAHEIAHTFLNHSARETNLETHKKWEEEADNLIVQWGFSKVYKDYDFDKVQKGGDENN